MDRWVGKVVVVTGASSGIGESIARELVRSGVNVVGLARRKENLENIQKSLLNCKGKLHPYQCDVADEESVVLAFKWVKETFGGVHALVNNAGIGIPGGIADVEPSVLKKVIDVNVVGLLYCTQQAVRIMKETRFEGTIININSILGHQVRVLPGIKLNAYCGSKYAVTGISETLQNELREDNLRIRVTSISPGLVQSELSTSEGFKEKLDTAPILLAEDVASSVTYVLSLPQRVQITELTIRPLGEAF